MSTSNLLTSVISTTLVTEAQNLKFYSAFTDKVERNCHFPAPGWNCMTHRQALQCFPYTSQVSLHRNKINLSILQQFLPGAVKKTVAFNFISERMKYTELSE
jgi:hypothetical protein